MPRLTRAFTPTHLALIAALATALLALTRAGPVAAAESVPAGAKEALALFVGRSHVSFEAIVSRREYAWLTTRPADLVGQSHSRDEPPDTG
jgi:hypothetical protein